LKTSFILTVLISIIVTLMFSLVGCLEWDPSAEGEHTNERGDWVFSIPALVKWMTGQDTASSTQEEQVEVAESAEAPKQEEKTPSSKNAPASEDVSQKSGPESQSNSSESNQEPKSYSVPDDWPLPYNDKISLEFTNKGNGFI
jgi:hypothetical protein